MNLPKIEADASSHAETILTLLESRDGIALNNFTETLSRDQTKYVLYAIGLGYIREVRANALAADQLEAVERVCEGLKAGNVELLDRVRSLIEDRTNQAARVAGLRSELLRFGVRAA
ncbi:hypothetical protein [Leucobacter sp. 1207-22]|uniref:hypothetical protein n=1 Tax=Leucobacter sp. 1207-22 TaxID=2604456 RepID=UPI0040643CF1